MRPTRDRSATPTVRDVRTAAREIAARAGTWTRSTPLEALCAELAAAVVGRPSAPGADSVVRQPPTADNGETFENHVFALRAYCRCGGQVHGIDPSGMHACPANFEYFRRDARVVRGEWFETLGKGTVFSGSRDPADVAVIRAACLRSLA